MANHAHERARMCTCIYATSSCGHNRTRTMQALHAQPGLYPSPMIFPIQGMVHVMKETHIVVDITHAVYEFERATVSVSEGKDTIIQKTKDNLGH